MLRCLKNYLILGWSICLVSGSGICLFGQSAEQKPIIKDKSPDGKFALQIVKKEEIGWEAAIISLKDKAAVVELEVYQNQGDSFIKQGRLVWSKDSQEVAYFEPDRKGGSTHVYFRKKSEFEEVDLPEPPKCKVVAPSGASYVSTDDSTTKPVKWLSSDALVLNVESTNWMEKEEGGDQFARTCSQDVTITFDANHKASVKSVKQVKSN
jgi:hypothetical protein